jgi:hypothetical protein
MKSHDHATGCAPLMQACTLQLYKKNIFRITGLPVDATTKEIARQAQKLQMQEEIGEEITGSKPAFALKINPTSEEIRAALSRMKEPQHRLVDEFFWYWPEKFGESKNDPAIQAMMSGDAQGAINIWRQRQKEGSDVAKHNMAVMFHMYAVDWSLYHVLYDIDVSMVDEIKVYWRKAFDRWEDLVDSDEIRDILKERIRSIGDEALTTGFVKRMLTDLPVALDMINAEAALKLAERNRMDWARFHVDFMNETHQGLDDVDSTAEMILAPTKARVEQHLDSYAKQVKTDPSKGAALASQLLANCRPMMDLFDLFYGKEAHQRNDIFDSVAETVLEMVISHQRATDDNRNFLKLLNETLNFTSSPLLRERILKNIAIGNKNIQEEKLSPIYKKLSSIRESHMTPKVKFDKLNQTVLPLLPQLISSLLNESKLSDQVHDSIAALLRNISIEAYNDSSDIDTAMAAILLAQKFVRDRELRARIIQDIQQLTENKISSMCVFCESTNVSDSSMLEIAMHGEISRSQGTYKTGTIKVPRCISCAESSKNCQSTGCVGGIASVVIGLLIGISVLGPTGWFEGAFLGGVIGFIFVIITEQFAPESSNFAKIKKYSVVADRINSGWKFGAKPPQ